MSEKQEYFLDISQTNGLGSPAVSLYLRGCDKEVPCDDCHNMELYNETGGTVPLVELKSSLRGILEQFVGMYGSGNIKVAILGGEPLSRDNREITHAISRYVKELYNKSMVIVYSWREFDDIADENLNRFLRYVDYGVLGPFEKDKAVENTIPSSTNQKIYNLKTGFVQKNIHL